MVSALFSPKMPPSLAFFLELVKNGGRTLKMELLLTPRPTTSATAVTALLVFVLGLAFSAPVFAQSRDLQPILDRLLRMERDIKTLNIQVARGGGAIVVETETGTPAVARIDVRLSELEEELRAATGKVETMTNQIEQVGLRLDKLIADLDYRLSAIESGAGQLNAQNNVQGVPQLSAAPSPPGVQQAVPGAGQPGVLGTISQSDVANLPVTDENQQDVAPVPLEGSALPVASGVLPEGTPKERYDFAFGLLRQTDYDKAEVALSEFLKAHSNDPLAGNARYWLAESYYVRRQYVQAAESFVAGYQANTSGPKAPDMLLKLGMSMSNLDKKEEACASFGKLLEDFPQAAARIISKVTFERKKIGCQ